MDEDELEILFLYLETLLKRYEKGEELSDDELELLDEYLEQNLDLNQWGEPEEDFQFFDLVSPDGETPFVFLQDGELLEQGWEFMTSDPLDA
jgi:hypothetical protein